LMGSNDNVSWDVLDEQRITKPWNINENRTYIIRRPRKYRYLRLQVELGVHPSILRIYRLLLMNFPGQLVGTILLPASRREFIEIAGKQPVTVTTQFEKPLAATHYQLEAGIDMPEAVERMPSAWILLGRQDGKPWQLLDERSGQVNWQPGEQRAFRVASPHRVMRYRLIIFETSGKVGAMRLQNLSFHTELSRANKTTKGQTRNH